MKIDKEVQTTEVLTEGVIFGKVHSKRKRGYVANDNEEDENEPNEKPPSTKQMLAALQVYTEKFNIKAILMC
jgi:hypothetical protein